MRRNQKFIVAIKLIAASLSAGIILMIPMAGSGQSQEGRVRPQKNMRDPFLLPPGVHLLPKLGSGLGEKETSSETGSKPQDSMKVKAILISDHIRLASIDHQIGAEGDSVRGEKILEIRPDRVILGAGDQKRTLLLSQNPIQITVEDIKERNDED